MSHVSSRPSLPFAWFAAAFLLFSVLAMGAYALIWPEAPYRANDSQGYLAVARDLADGQMDKISMRTTGYPLLLLLTGSTEAPTRTLFFVSLMFHFAAVWMLLIVLLRLGFTRRCVAAFALVASLPPFVEPAAFALTENLSQLLLVGAFACLSCWLLAFSGSSAGGTEKRPRGNWRWSWAAASGLLFGASALVRPSFQLAGFVAAAVTVLVFLQDTGLHGKGLEAEGPSLSLRTGLRTALPGAAWVAGTSLLLLLLYSTWSWQRFDHFGLAPGTLGYSLSTKTSSVLERLPEKYAAEREILIAGRDANLVERGSSHTGEQFLPGTKPALSEATGLTGLALDDHILQLNLLLIKKAPLHFLWHSLRSVPTFFFPTIGRAGHRGSSGPLILWVAFHFAWIGFFCLQLVVVSGGVVLLWTRRFRKCPWFFWRGTLPLPETGPYLLAGGIIVYTMLISCGLHHGEARYRSPVDLLILLSCVLGVRLWRHLAKDPETPEIG